MNDHDTPLAAHIEDSREKLKHYLHDCSDASIYHFRIGEQLPGMFVFFSGLTHEDRMDELRKEMAGWRFQEEDGSLQEQFQYRVAGVCSEEISTMEELVDHISIGSVILLVDGINRGYAFSLAEWRKRAIEDPAAESVIRGPREGFTESIVDNRAMLRRRLRSQKLKMKGLEVGRLSKSHITIAYIEGLAAPELVMEVEDRIGMIEIDGVLESGTIEEYIEDQPYSPFPQLLSTERPDAAAAGLLEGRVVILTDNTPMALIAPVSLFSLLQSPEDYYERFLIATAIRWLRYSFFFIALLVPSGYVALLTYHHEMVPSALLLSIAKSREDIPFPALMEAFMMETMFEALREAGVRLPKQVGAAVSIVGALVIGQAATSAGLVSSPMVMVVAITGIASFLLPHYSVGISIRLLRFPMMLLAGIFGLLGLLMGIIGITIHLCSLRSFGMPYLSPIAPMMVGEWKDVIMRAPAWLPRKRPRLTKSGGSWRNKPGMHASKLHRKQE